MTDNVRDEVHQLVLSAMEVARGVGDGSKSESDGFQAHTQATDAITNLVLGVKELEWRIDPDLGAEHGFAPGFDDCCYNVTSYTKDGAQVWSAWLHDPDEGELPDQGPFSSQEAAKAACQADFAKRIHSALTANPAPVVSDEMLEAARSVILNVDEGTVLTDAEARSILTAALPHATTEADIRAEHLAEITELRERLHTKHSEIRSKVIENLVKRLPDDSNEFLPVHEIRQLLSQGEG